MQICAKGLLEPPEAEPRREHSSPELQVSAIAKSFASGEIHFISAGSHNQKDWQTFNKTTLNLVFCNQTKIIFS